MVRSHSYKTVKHIQPSKTGVKTNINNDERFWEDDLRKKFVKKNQQNKSSYCGLIWTTNALKRLDYVQFKLFNLIPSVDCCEILVPSSLFQFMLFDVLLDLVKFEWFIYSSYSFQLVKINTNETRIDVVT